MGMRFSFEVSPFQEGEHAMATRVPALATAKLEVVTSEHMQRIPSDPTRVVTCFQNPMVKQAA
jgi:hypothetical protein